LQSVLPVTKGFGLSAAFALAAALTACEPASAPPARVADTVVVESRRVGHRLPALTVATFSPDSATIGGSALQPVTLLNLWSTTCGPCIEELPSLVALHARYARLGLRVLAVSVDRGDGEVKAFLLRYPVTFPIGRDPDGHIAEALASTSLPQNVLISADGRVLFRETSFGTTMPKALMTAIEASLRGP
jgi:thiol-disulfide isomerase/thioredoxin